MNWSFSEAISERYLLADRLAQIVRFGRAEPGDLAGDQHALLLVHRDAGRLRQDPLEPGIGVGDRLPAVLASGELGDVLHRAGPVQGTQRDQVLEPGGPHLAQRLAHAARLELEHAGRVALGQHLVGAGVVQRQVLHRQPLPAGLLDQLDRAVDHVQVAQPQEVHLQQAQRLDIAHRELRHDLGLGALLLQRQVLGQRPVADHDGGGMDRVVAHDTLQRPRHVHDRAGGVVHVVDLAEFGARLHALLERHLRALGHQLGDAVDLAVADAHHASRILDGGLGLHLAERDDLGDAAAAVLLGHVVDDALAAGHREVDVDVRHALAAGFRNRSNSSE